MWTLVTAPDERERCMVVEDGERCTRPSQWMVRAIDGSPDDYACVCGEHLELVSGPRYLAEPIDAQVTATDPAATPAAHAPR